MARTAARRKAQRAYHLRRKVAKAPRSDDIQRALAQALKDSWQVYFTDKRALALLSDVLKSARSRLVARGFDAAQAERRLLLSLKEPDKMLTPQGRVGVWDGSGDYGVRFVDAKDGKTE